MQLYRLFVALDAAGVTDVAPYADAVGVVAVGDVALVVVALGAVAATATALFDFAVFAIVLRRQTFCLTLIAFNGLSFVKALTL